MKLTLRQRVLKFIYPLFLLFKKIKGRRKFLYNKDSDKPTKSIYSLSVQLNNGQELPLDKLKGKKILIVNTASNCGFTRQYEDLQRLYEKYKDSLQIIGFPANDFKEQEKGTDEEIADFCKVNFGVSFPLAKKSTVIKKPSQNKVFRWLSFKEENGWNEKAPGWNFSKYLINEDGVLTHYFEPAVSPLSEDVIEAVRIRKE